MVKGVGIVLATLGNAKTSRISSLLSTGGWDSLLPLALRWAVSMVPMSPLELMLSQPQTPPCCCLSDMTAPYTSSQGASKWQPLFFLPFFQSRQLQQGPHDSMVSFWVMSLKPLPLSAPFIFNSTSFYFPHHSAFMPSETGCWKSMYVSDSSFPKPHLPSQRSDRYSITQHNLSLDLTQSVKISTLGSYWEELSKHAENRLKKNRFYCLNCKTLQSHYLDISQKQMPQILTVISLRYLLL